MMDTLLNGSFAAQRRHAHYESGQAALDAASRRDWDLAREVLAPVLDDLRLRDALLSPSDPGKASHVAEHITRVTGAKPLLMLNGVALDRHHVPYSTILDTGGTALDDHVEFGPESSEQGVIAKGLRHVSRGRRATKAAETGDYGAIPRELGPLMTTRVSAAIRSASPGAVLSSIAVATGYSP